MGTRTLPIEPEQAARLLLAVQAGDAVASATLPILQRDLVRLGCPLWMRRTIPALKAASAVGLVAGRRSPRLGRLTTDALVAYFLCALGAHGRVRDPAWRWAAAAGMLGLVLVARQAYAEDTTDAGEPARDGVTDGGAAGDVVDLTGSAPAEEAVVDLTGMEAGDVVPSRPSTTTPSSPRRS